LAATSAMVSARAPASMHTIRVRCKVMFIPLVLSSIALV
jgi:hypothetical protein